MSTPTPEQSQLDRTVLSAPGGGVASSEPWSKYTPLDCIRKMDNLMSLILRCGGDMAQYEEDWERMEVYRPFSVTPRLADPTFFGVCSEFVQRAWYLPTDRVSSSHLRYFYSVIIDGETTQLPYIARPEASAEPVSWFQSTGDGFWCTMRPSSQALPLYVQDISARSVLYRMGAASSPADFTGPASVELQNLLKLVRQMGQSNDEASKNLVSRAVTKHMDRIMGRNRPKEDQGGGGIFSLYSDER